MNIVTLFLVFLFVLGKSVDVSPVVAIAEK